MDNLNNSTNLSKKFNTSEQKKFALEAEEEKLNILSNQQIKRRKFLQNQEMFEEATFSNAMDLTNRLKVLDEIDNITNMAHLKQKLKTTDKEIGKGLLEYLETRDHLLFNLESNKIPENLFYKLSIDYLNTKYLFSYTNLESSIDSFLKESVETIKNLAINNSSEKRKYKNILSDDYSYHCIIEAIYINTLKLLNTRYENIKQGYIKLNNLVVNNCLANEKELFVPKFSNNKQKETIDVLNDSKKLNKDIKLFDVFFLYFNCILNIRH